MAVDFTGKLVVAISSRALFNLDAGHRIYEEQGIEAYQKFQINHENEILEPGVAFNLVKKFLALNQTETLVEVILLSRNSADTGLRIFNSIEYYGLDISRAAFSSGKTPYKYVQAFGSDLFLSANPEDVCHALQAGVAAATITPTQKSINESTELRIAFDGDAVIFSDEAEKIFQSEGLTNFANSEKQSAHKPLTGGPFRGFLAALENIQKKFPARQSPIRTALVTARSAPAHERVIRTLREWDIRIDEALFLGGLKKTEFLKAFGADFFFDDQQGHCIAASEHVATGHVPHGIMNQRNDS